MCDYRVKNDDICLPMTKRRDEIQATVNSVIYDVFPIQSALVREVLFKLVIYISNNWRETVRREREREGRSDKELKLPRFERSSMYRPELSMDFILLRRFKSTVMKILTTPPPHPSFFTPKVAADKKW